MSGEMMCVQFQPGWAPGEAKLTLARGTGKVTLPSHRLSASEEPLLASHDMGHKSPCRAGPTAATQKWCFPFSPVQVCSHGNRPSRVSTEQSPDSYPEHPPRAVPLQAPWRVSPEDRQPDPCSFHPTQRPLTLGALKPLHRKARTQPSNLEKAWTSLHLWVPPT